MIRKILSLLLALAVILPFSACSGEGGGEPSPSDGAASKTEAETTPNGNTAGEIFQKSEISQFKVVYAAKLENETMSEVNRLVSRINSACGTEIVSTGDLIIEQSEKNREWEHEILVGCTNREESALFGEALRQYDYGFGYVNGKIVIYAKCESYLKNAINSFIVSVLMGHEKESVFYDSSWGSVVRYHYGVESLTVNGASIREYEIIYPEADTLYEKELAERLRCYVLEKTGYDLTVKKDSEPRNSSHAFHVGKTKFTADFALETVAGHNGMIFCNGGDIVIYGNTMSGMVHASKQLTDLLVDPESREKERTVVLDQSITVEASEGYSVMTFNIFTGDMTSKRIDRVMDAINRSLPDVMGLQEVNSTWMSHLQSKLSSYYGFVGTDLSDGKEGVPILYAKDRFHLIESGCNWLTDTPDTPSKLEGQQYPRNYTYALLEDKETGARFLLLNTHLDTAGSKIRYAEVELLMRFLQGYSNVPVVLVGDLNAKRNTNELNYLTSFRLATVFDYKELAGMKKNSAAIDWIYMTSDSIIMTYHTYDDSLYNGDYPSDHYPYYAEFVIRT